MRSRLVILFVLINVICFSYNALASIEIMQNSRAIYFQGVSPLGLPAYIADAIEFSVNAPNSASLQVQAESNFVGQMDSDSQIPIERLLYFPKIYTSQTGWTVGTWTPFSLAVQDVAQMDFLNCYLISLDLQFKTQWEDVIADDSYKTKLVFTLSGGNYDNDSYAQPASFYVGEGYPGTTIHYRGSKSMVDDSNQVRIYDCNGHLVKQGSPTEVIDIDADKRVAYFNWDGRHHDGFFVEPGVYTYFICKVGMGDLGAGVLTVLDPNGNNNSPGNTKIFGHIRNQEGTALRDVRVELYRAGTDESDLEFSNGAGRYQFNKLAAGHYYIKVIHDYYLPYHSEVFYLAEKEKLEKDIVLLHNDSFFMEVTSNRRKASIGDIITYMVTLKNIGTGSINQVKIAEDLPEGLRYLKDSALLGEEKAEPAINGRRLIWDLDDMAVGEEIVLTYQMLVGYEAPVGWLYNQVHAFGFADDYIEFGPLGAPVYIEASPFEPKGRLLGRVVYADSLEGVAGIEIKLSGGGFAATDEKGFFSFSDLPRGTHILKVLPATLPLGWVTEKDFYFIDMAGGVPRHLDIALVAGTVPAAEFSLEGIAGFEIDWRHGSGISAVDFGGLLDLTVRGEPLPDYYLDLAVNAYGHFQPRDDGIFRQGPKLKKESPLRVELSTPHGYLGFQKEKVRDRQEGINLSSANVGAYLLSYKKEFEDIGQDVTLFFGFTETGREMELLPAEQQAGPYQLKRQTIKPFSEKVLIKIMEGNEVISERKVAYSIDYQKGIIYLDELLAPYENGNKVYLAITYDYKPENIFSTDLFYGLGTTYSPADGSLVKAEIIGEKNKRGHLTVAALGIDATEGNLSLAGELAGSIRGEEFGGGLDFHFKQKLPGILELRGQYQMLSPFFQRPGQNRITGGDRGLKDKLSLSVARSFVLAAVPVEVETGWSRENRGVTRQDKIYFSSVGEDFMNKKLTGGFELAYLHEQDERNLYGWQLGIRANAKDILAGMEGYGQAQISLLGEEERRHQVKLGVKGDIIEGLRADSSISFSNRGARGKISLAYSRQSLVTEAAYRYSFRGRQRLCLMVEGDILPELSALFNGNYDFNLPSDGLSGYDSSLELNYRSKKLSLPLDVWALASFGKDYRSRDKELLLELGSVYRFTPRLQLGGRYDYKKAITDDGSTASTNLFVLGTWWEVSSKIALSPYLTYLSQKDYSRTLGAGLEVGILMLPEAYLVLGYNYKGSRDLAAEALTGSPNQLYLRLTSVFDWMK